MSDPRAQPGRRGEGREPAPHWVASPLLLKPQETPRFLRAAWDQQTSHAFGPWRVGDPVDPVLPVHEMAPPAGAAGAQASGTAHDAASGPHDTEVIDVPSPALDESHGTGTDGDADQFAHPAHSARLAEAEARGYARGLEEGRAQALAEVEAERAREAELIRHLAIELRALSEDSDRFFEPLRRLALHIAEQLVRGELQASSQAITQIVRQALAALDPPPGDPVLVCLHPEDVAMLQEAAPSFLEADGLKIQPDPQLHRGSVRLRLDDTVLEDLVEHRLQALVDRLLVHPGGAASPRGSVLLNEFTPVTPINPGASGMAGQAGLSGASGLAGSAEPLAAGLRRRGAALGDVIDTTARPMPTPAEEGEAPRPGAADGEAKP